MNEGGKEQIPFLARDAGLSALEHCWEGERSVLRRCAVVFVERDIEPIAFCTSRCAHECRLGV